MRVYGLVAELVEEHIDVPELETGLVGIEVAGCHPCQQDFLVVLSGQYLVFIGERRILLFHRET